MKKNIVKVDLKLHSKQGTIFKDPTRFRVVPSGRRFGKTHYAAVDLIYNSLNTTKGRFWYVAPTYRQAKRIFWQMLKNMIPLALKPKYNESELSVYFPMSGSIIELAGADKPDSLLGVGLNLLIVDEFASIRNSWGVWYEFLRPMLTDKKGRCTFIGTPKGKDAFFELYMKGLRHEEGYSSHSYKTLDNPYIDPAEVEEARRTMPERYFRQEYEASFESYEGLVYPEFNDHHIVAPFEIPDWWERVGGIDPAMSGTSGALKGCVDEEGVLYIYDEYYEKDRRVSEVCNNFCADDKVGQWFIDPASKIKNCTVDGKLYTLYDEYRECGVVVREAENAVNAGINRVAEMMKKYKIKIFSYCFNLIWELEQYHWADRKDTINGEIEAKPYKKDDHLCDIVRYLCMSRPSKSIEHTPRKVSRWSVEYEMDKMNAEANDWRKKYQTVR